MKTCQYYKGTEQVGADSTRILCSYMASGGKVFKNNDPESAALIQCCWHAEKAEKECPLWNIETSDAILDKPDAVSNDEDEDVDGIEFNEGDQLRTLADEFRKMTKICPYYSSEYGKVEVNYLGAMEFECEHTKMIFAEESKAGEWLERCCSAPENCYHYRKAKEEEGQPVEQQTFTTEIAEKADTSISTERQDRAAQLTQRIMANGKIAASSMIEMGRDLKTVRDERLFTEMGYENFEEYCEKKIGIGKRHGYNFIQIYEKFGEEKLGQLQQLGITKLLEIAKLDDEDADDLMRHNDVNALSVRELSAKVDEYRNKFEQLTLQLEEEKSKNAESTSLESQVEELRKQLEVAHQANEDMESGALNAEKRFEEQKAALLKEKVALSEQIKELESRPAEKAEISEEERNALIQQGRDEMCKKKDEDWSNAVELAKKTVTRETTKKFTEEINSLKTLNDELRKVADGAKESAKKYKDELEKQKAENAALQSNAQVVEVPAPAPTSGARDKVKFYFKQIETAFTAATEAVSEADTEERAELTSALKKVLERMGTILEQT
ncbi:MAG TPA: hypothetical protein DHW32_10320 [Ruminococcaceae bacterium]|jgi:hypothetical protein|nr:hypothetical protein [Oscillospiraceae bacterium]HCK51115.1 hypothetical protein [Oscillospiraceae bacterium]